MAGFLESFVRTNQSLKDHDVSVASQKHDEVSERTVTLSKYQELSTASVTSRKYHTESEVSSKVTVFPLYHATCTVHSEEIERMVPRLAAV